MENNSELSNLQYNVNGNVKIFKGQYKKSRDAQKPLGERRKAVLRQRLMVLLGNTGVLGAGMSVAMPAVTLTQLTDSTANFFLTKDESSWFSSMNTMSCPIGGLIVGYLMDKLGRKWTMGVMNIAGVIGWFLLSTAQLQSTKAAIYSQILVARFFSGIMMGLCISPVGVYSAEISLPKIRGRLILCTSIGMAAGILLMYVLGYFIRHNWQLISIISCVYQLISTICVLPLPETPSWLMERGDDDRAKKSLKYFRGLKRRDTPCCDEFQVELTQLKKNTEISRNIAATETSFWSTLKAPEVYKPLALMLGFFAFQQLSGVVVVVVFAVQIASSAGISTDPVLCAVFVGLARMLTIVFMNGIFERWGRKPAGIISAGGMAMCMILLAISGWYKLEQTVPLLPYACIILYIVFTTMGLLTLPFFMISEVFPQRIRGAASGMTICFGLLMSFAVIKVYPFGEDIFGTSTVFAFFGCAAAGAVFYIYFLIPETKGRSLLEIEEYFRTGKFQNSIAGIENGAEQSKLMNLAK